MPLSCWVWNLDVCGRLYFVNDIMYDSFVVLCDWRSLLIKAGSGTTSSRNAFMGALCTVEHQRVCIVGGRMR